jgi:NAD-dependent dihydropyrimidine dehydrogenase PreA subunit
MGSREQVALPIDESWTTKPSPAPRRGASSSPTPRAWPAVSACWGWASGCTRACQGLAAGRDPAARRLAGNRFPRRLHPLRPVRARLPLRHPAPGQARGADVHRHALLRRAPAALRDVRGHSLRQGLSDRRAGPFAEGHQQVENGLAVLVDHETCLNFLGLRCDICYRVCPVIDKAITLDRQVNARTGRHTHVHSRWCIPITAPAAASARRPVRRRSPRSRSSRSTWPRAS